MVFDDGSRKISICLLLGGGLLAQWAYMAKSARDAAERSHFEIPICEISNGNQKAFVALYQGEIINVSAQCPIHSGRTTLIIKETPDFYFYGIDFDKSRIYESK